MKSAKIIALMSLAAFALVAAVPAEAAECARREKVTAFLAEQFEEAPVGMGIGRASGNVYELLVSETGSWTFTSTTPQGVMCILSGGRSWEAVSKPRPPVGEGS